MVLCRFFSRTVGSCEATEATEGLDRRPREPEESLLSFVEVLADEECLLSVAEVGAKVLVASPADGSQAGSCLNGWSIPMSIQICFNAVYTYIIFLMPRFQRHQEKRAEMQYQCRTMNREWKESRDRERRMLHEKAEERPKRLKCQ